MTSTGFDVPASAPDAGDLVAMLKDSRARTLDLVAGLDGERLKGPQLPIVNPLLWEIGHLAWFHEHFILRHLDGASCQRPDADALYDSSAVHHDTRWDLPLPSLDETLGYMAAVQEALVARLDGREPTDEERYLYRLTTFHEDMHGEAFTYSRQSLRYPAPVFGDRAADTQNAGPLPGDVPIPGGPFRLGAEPGDGFAFDNEKWAHPVSVAPFAMARAPVTNADFAAFVEAGGYADPRHWSPAGWAWREAAGAHHPVYWVPDGDGFDLRRFDAVVPWAPHQPVMNVCFHEAEAWCHWAGRRLPSEAEWEFAATMQPDDSAGRCKATFPWGNAADTASRVNLDGRRLGPVDVAAFPEGDSAWGCRQMIGNVWEWTNSDFLPYPGFSPDIYADYSVPAFGRTKVLRGGAWITRSRMINARYRNYFAPHRRDIYAGFRSVAL